MLALVAVSALAAPLVRCANVAEMVALNIPEASILESLELPFVRDDDWACLATLPPTIRERFSAIPIAGPADEPVPDAAPEAATVTRDEARARFVDPVVAMRQVYELPDPGVAVGLAGFLGFGAGCYHARLDGAGATFTLVDGAAVAVFVAGVTMTADLNDSGPPAMGVGGAMFALSRLVQIGIAAPMTRREALRRIAAGQAQ